MEHLKIHNWDRWQSYRKDRGQPPWIKIHRRLLRNPEWVSLSDAERGQLVAIWLLAADHDGVVPASPEVIQKLCYMNKTPDLNKFIELGFIESNGCHIGVKLASSGSQDVTPKAEAETEKRRINTLDSFEAFWKAYPKRKNKAHALKAWKKLNSPAETLNQILIALEWQKNTDQWLKDNGQYIPYPSSYLNARSWEDEPYGRSGNSGGHDSPFLRALREAETPKTHRSMGAGCEAIRQPGDSPGRTQVHGRVPENADSVGSDMQDKGKTSR